jgi:hypothetical protein
MTKKLFTNKTTHAVNWSAILSLITILVSLFSLNINAAEVDFEYFKQFLYQDEVDNSDPDFPNHQYRWLMSHYDLKISLDADHDLNPVISLFLLPDGHYKMVYKENIFDKKNANSFMPGKCKIIEGRWDVPDTNLLIDNLAYGTRHLENNQNAVMLYFKQNIFSPVLQGAPISMSLGFGNYDISQAKCFPF